MSNHYHLFSVQDTFLESDKMSCFKVKSSPAAVRIVHEMCASTVSLTDKLDNRALYCVFNVVKCCILTETRTLSFA